MRLLEYARSDELDVVDAVFADTEARYWHFQLVNASGTGGASPRIHFAHLDERPPVGRPAGYYREWPLGEDDARLAKHRWFELIVLALQSRGGWEAMARAALS